VFEHHLPSLVRHCHDVVGDDPDARRRIEQLRSTFAEQLRTLRRDPEAFGPLSILRICRLRETALRAIDLPDPYRPVKQRENDEAVGLLPSVLAELDAMEENARLLSLIRGVFAGNVFDLGARSTTQMFEDTGFDFLKTRRSIVHRPWLIDDFDALVERWAEPYRKAIVFVDNAGADVVLGMIPLCREMLRRGTTVIITANSLPALNDITIEELDPLLERIAAVDAVVGDALAAGRLRTVGSGNDAPLIDLRETSDGADLVVLEGMGRALESNLYAEFTCDSLKLATIKEQQLAELLGGRMYDVVCKFRRVN